MKSRNDKCPYCSMLRRTRRIGDSAAIRRHATTQEPSSSPECHSYCHTGRPVANRKATVKEATGRARGPSQTVQEDKMKKFIATLLTTLLMSAPAFANSFSGSTNDPAASRDKTAKGAVIGGTLGAAVG